MVDAVSIPVIASGGIADGRGWMAAHALGAEGIEMGTRFIATKECIHASVAYQNTLINSGEMDTVVIKKILLVPRQELLKNSWTDEILSIEKVNPTYDALKDYVSGEANKQFIYEGDEHKGFGWAGQSVGLIEDIPSVQELFNRMEMQAMNIINNSGNNRRQYYMEYTYPFSLDRSTEIVDVVQFFEAIEKAYENGIKREELMKRYRRFKEIVPSIAEEKTYFREFEKESGYVSFPIIKKMKEQSDGTIIKG